MIRLRGWSPYLQARCVSRSTHSFLKNVFSKIKYLFVNINPYRHRIISRYHLHWCLMHDRLYSLMKRWAVVLRRTDCWWAKIYRAFTFSGMGFHSLFGFFAVKTYDASLNDAWMCVQSTHPPSCFLTRWGKSWPSPGSLTTTNGISVDFFSSSY